MQPHDAPLRDELAVLAAEATPLGFTAEAVVAKVRRRRRRAVAGAATGAAALVLGVAAVVSWLGAGAQAGRTMAGSPGVVPPSAAPSTVYRCGDRLVLPDTAASRNGLTMSIGSIRKVRDDVGPDISVTFTATASLQITASPPTLFEVVYLADGVVVGGGPMLNQPKDPTSQGIDLLGHQFAVGPRRPSVQDVGRRNALCPPLNWSTIWSQPQSYEVVVLQGAVETIAAGEVVLGVPLPLDAPLLVSRAGLTE